MCVLGDISPELSDALIKAASQSCSCERYDYWLYEKMWKLLLLLKTNSNVWCCKLRLDQQGCQGFWNIYPIAGLYQIFLNFERLRNGVLNLAPFSRLADLILWALSARRNSASSRLCYQSVGELSMAGQSTMLNLNGQEQIKTANLFSALSKFQTHLKTIYMIITPNWDLIGMSTMVICNDLSIRTKF